MNRRTCPGSAPGTAGPAGAGASAAGSTPTSATDSPAITGLDHVQLAAPAGCEVEARRFFGGLLGLAEVEKPAVLAVRGGVWFAVGDQQLHVGVARDVAPARKAHPALRVASRAALETLARRLVEGGVEVRWDDDLPGSARFYVDDPWGNRLELVAVGRGPREPPIGVTPGGPGEEKTAGCGCGGAPRPAAVGR